jgi:hypothetical protein
MNFQSSRLCQFKQNALVLRSPHEKESLSRQKGDSFRFSDHAYELFVQRLVEAQRFVRSEDFGYLQSCRVLR